jgi:hypothetical protein
MRLRVIWVDQEPAQKGEGAATSGQPAEQRPANHALLFREVKQAEVHGGRVHQAHCKAKQNRVGEKKG